MNSNQLVFGLFSGVEKVRPFQEGDVVVKQSGVRYVISQVCDVDVFACVNLSTGGEAIVFAREIAYRSC